MSSIQLSRSERRLLKVRMNAAESADVYRRSLALLSVDKGRDVDDVAMLLEVDRRTVFRWLQRYKENRDLSVLRRRPGQGRPRLLSKDERSFLKDALLHSPQEFGYHAANWTVPLLHEHISSLLDADVSSHTIRRQLEELGYVWKRYRYVLPPDPEREKKRRILRNISNLGGDSVVIALDETYIRLFPPLRSGWALRGQEARVPISGYNDKRVLFGAINIRTGHRIWLVRKCQRQEDFQAFLQTIKSHYRSWHIVILLDEHSSHTAIQSKSLASERGIDLLWLPHRSPHLNPMDHLWRHGKQTVSANIQYETIDEHAIRFIEYLNTLSTQEALKKSAMLSENFWLHKAL